MDLKHRKIFERHGSSAYRQVPVYQGTVNFEQSAYMLRETADPDVFIAEIDTVAFTAGG